jgi:hypothetical protein
VLTTAGKDLDDTAHITALSDAKSLTSTHSAHCSELLGVIVDIIELPEVVDDISSPCSLGNSLMGRLKVSNSAPLRIISRCGGEPDVIRGNTKAFSPRSLIFRTVPVIISSIAGRASAITVISSRSGDDHSIIVNAVSK